MRYAVFCSANENIDPECFMQARELGRRIGSGGHELVFGGCDMGLMGCIARAVKQSGGTCVGVVPTVIEKGGKAFADLDEQIMCTSLSQRKDMMIDRSDVIVALPGGVGTLDEIFTVLAATSIGYIDRKVILLNVNGFWNPLVEMLRKMERGGVIRSGFWDSLVLANSIDEIPACGKLT